MDSPPSTLPLTIPANAWEPGPEEPNDATHDALPVLADDKVRDGLAVVPINKGPNEPEVVFDRILDELRVVGLDVSGGALACGINVVCVDFIVVISSSCL